MHFSFFDILLKNLEYGTTFFFQHICYDCMRDLLNSFNVKKATGHDDISAKMLKLSAPIIHILLVHIFNNSNIFPSHSKVATVTPVFKKDDPLQKKITDLSVSLVLSVRCLKKSLSNNFRPLSSLF